MKKIIPLLLFLIITIISTLTLVAAEIQIETYSTEFFTGAKKGPTLCLCEEKTDEITIRNEAPYPQVFDITTNLDRAEIPVRQVTLNPQQEMKIPIILRARCDEKPTIKEYDVKIRSTTGREQTIQRNLEIKECQTITAKLYADTNTTNICAPTTYTIELENPSTFEEQYLIGPLRNVEWFEERGYEVILKPNQKSILNFTFLPSCDAHGKINNEFRIQANKSNLQANLNHELTIKPGYDFIMHGLDEINTCRYEKIKKEYTITNNGLINNTYELRLRGNPNFVELEKEKITLEPDETKKINLIIEPGFRTREQYEFTLDAKTKIGNQEAKKEIELNINDCYEATLTIKDPEDLRVCQGIQELEVKLENRGDRTETYELKTNTPKATLENETLTIMPGEEKTTKLTIDTTEFEDKILFQIDAYSTRDLLKHWEDTIIIDVVKSEDCSKISFPRRYNVYSRYYEEQVWISVTNEGIQKETYTVNYNGSDYLDLLTKEITIKPGEDKTITLNKTREHEQEEYYFELTLETTTGERYNKEFRLILTGTPITEQILDYARENPCFAVGLILLAIIIIYAITLTTIPINAKVKTIIAIILVLIITIMLIYQGLPERINPRLEQPEDPYAFKVYEGQKIKIDLYDYIKDPDGDPLNFTIESEPRYLRLEQEHNKITIHTENFTESDRFRVKADDGRGGRVTTPRYNIEVVEKTKLTTKETYEKYCPHINIALIIILLIITILAKTKKTRNDKKNKEDTKTRKTAKKTTKTAKTKKTKTTKTAKNKNTKTPRKTQKRKKKTKTKKR